MDKRYIYIAGVARSGSSWLGQIFNSSPSVRFRFQPFFAYEFKGRVDEDSSSVDFKRLLADMYQQDSEFLLQKDKQRTGDYPVFIKNRKPTHLAFKENRYQYLIEPMMRKVPTMKLVGLIRNPCATLSSWMNAEKEFPSTAVPLKEWRFGDCKNQGHEDFFGYYKWKEVANLYLDLKEKWPERVFVISYEDLVNSRERVVQQMFSFCSIPYVEQTVQFLKESSISNGFSPYSVYKDKACVDQWKGLLDPYIVDEIYKDLAGTRLECFLR